MTGKMVRYGGSQGLFPQQIWGTLRRISTSRLLSKREPSALLGRALGSPGQKPPSVNQCSQFSCIRSRCLVKEWLWEEYEKHPCCTQPTTQPLSGGRRGGGGGGGATDLRLGHMYVSEKR